MNSGTGGFDSHALPPTAALATLPSSRVPSSREASELVIREYRPGDERAILTTFNRVFAAEDPSFVARDLETWRWQFLANPSGWRMFLALTPDGEVVSQYAGIGQRVLLEGEAARFSQSVDSMSDPKWRRGLKRPGAFVLTGRPFAETYGGSGPQEDSVMWGWPVPAAWRIGSRYLGYEMVRTLSKLECDPTRLVPGEARDLTVGEVRSFPPETDELFGRVAREHGAIAVRDVQQLSWRFIDHPGRSYRIGLAHGDGLRGLAVYRCGDFDGARRALICDWLVPAEDDRARSALLSWLAACAREDGQDRMVAVLPDTSQAWLDFQSAGFRVRPLGYVLAARSYRRPIAAEWLRRNWWWTLGDTDLV